MLCSVPLFPPKAIIPFGSWGCTPFHVRISGHSWLYYSERARINHEQVEGSCGPTIGYLRLWCEFFSVEYDMSRIRGDLYVWQKSSKVKTPTIDIECSFASLAHYVCSGPPVNADHSLIGQRPWPSANSPITAAPLCITLWCHCYRVGTECSIHCHRDDHDCGNIAALSIRTEIALVKLRGLRGSGHE